MARHISVAASVLAVGGRTSRLPLFIKALPSSSAHRDFLREMQHFDKEMGMYESAVPAMLAALPEGTEPPVPRVFLTKRGDEPLIVMEDLRANGYSIWDKMAPMDRGHCLSVLSCLARFHGGALLVQGGAQAIAEGPFHMATDTILREEREGPMAAKWVDSSVRTLASAAAGMWPERFGGAEAQQRMQRELREAWSRVSKMAKPSSRHANAVCHGDLWANNIMFRYDSEGEPVDAKLVDLQLVRYAPPAADILMFLHLSTTKAFRDEHGRDLLLAYYRYLEEAVGKTALEGIMTLNAFLESIEEYALFGKLVGSVWMSIILGSEEQRAEGEPIDFATIIMRDRGEKVLSDAARSAVFAHRVAESYEECLRFLSLWT
nr:adult-specific protein A7 [Ischnura senegalensis]